MDKENLKQKIGVSFGTLGLATLATLCGLSVADRITAKPKTVKGVESEVKIKGYPSPFTSWDAYCLHEIEFKDGSKTYEKTRDFDFPIFRKITGFKPRHPQPGDRYLHGGVLGKFYKNIKR